MACPGQEGAPRCGGDLLGSRPGSFFRHGQEGRSRARPPWHDSGSQQFFV